MLKKTLFIAIILLIWIISFPSQALACACCAEPGTYRIRTGPPAEYQLEILSEMVFDKNAHLYMTEADFEIIKGLDELKKDFASENWVATAGEFDLVNSFLNKTWKLNFKTKSGKTGTLVLRVPAQMVQFKVDIHDTKDTGLGVSLYKEFRFKGTVQSGSGFFKAGIVRPTSYFLVFQGRGNGCDNASDFTHWHLAILRTELGGDNCVVA